MSYLFKEYPAIIYKNKKNNIYIANCIMKNVIGIGKSEFEAIKNLKNKIEPLDSKYFIKIKPLYN